MAVIGHARVGGENGANATSTPVIAPARAWMRLAALSSGPRTIAVEGAAPDQTRFTSVFPKTGFSKWMLPAIGYAAR